MVGWLEIVSFEQGGPLIAFDCTDLTLWGIRELICGNTLTCRRLDCFILLLLERRIVYGRFEATLERCNFPIEGATDCYSFLFGTVHNSPRFGLAYCSNATPERHRKPMLVIIQVNFPSVPMRNIRGSKSLVGSKLQSWN